MTGLQDPNIFRSVLESLQTGVYLSGDNLETSVNSSEIKWWGDLLSVTVSMARTMVQAGDTQELLLERAQPLPGTPAMRGADPNTANSQS